MAEHVLTMTEPKAPWPTGDLERSGSAVVDESNLAGVISFDQPYAVAQHENLGWEHPLKGEFCWTGWRSSSPRVGWACGRPPPASA